ncbi:MAG: phospho-sugar mutase, partial [Pirellula sp.]
QGMADMKNLMEKLRSSPPVSIAGLPILAVRDYQSLTRKTSKGATEVIDAPKSNMLMLELGNSDGSPSGNAIAVRPSGTEPKIKFYLFGHENLKMASSEGLRQAKATVSERLQAMKKELASVAVRR